MYSSFKCQKSDFKSDDRLQGGFLQKNICIVNQTQDPLDIYTTGNIPHVATKSIKFYLTTHLDSCAFISTGNCDIGDFLEIIVFGEHS